MSPIEVRDEGRQCWIGLNRPDKRNAIDQAMVDALASALDEARTRSCSRRRRSTSRRRRCSSTARTNTIG